jgi:putative NADH-flavin reductase
MEQRILILGGTGRTGQHAIQYALDKGYNVNVLARNPDKVNITSNKLTVYEGSPTNIKELSLAMQDCHAVISLLSALPEKQSFSLKRIIPPHILQTSIQNSIQLMEVHHIKRILVLSSIGAGDSYRYAPWYMRLMIRITNFKVVFADHNAQEKLLMESSLNWTIARPVALNENADLGRLVLSHAETPKPFQMSRKHLARFFIDQIDKDTYKHQMPILSEAKVT